jgi:RHS repeat-associated protein
MDMEAGTRKQEWYFNARLQMVGMRVGAGASALSDCAYVAGSDQIHLSYGYGSSNNGNVQSQTIFPLGATQSYFYDNVNRLTQMQEGANVESYGYDRWGNRWVSGRAGTLPAVPTGVPVGEGAYLTNNRIGPGSACGPTGVYDCAGNLRDLLGTTADYDGENRVKSAVKGGTAVTYAYDGDGRRVKSTVGTVSTVFVYTAFGQLAAEYGAGPAEGRKYLYADALGSTRLESCAGCAQTVKRFDYLPFGEEMSTSSRTAGLGYGLSGSERVKFTGKERDVETGLDYFGLRYMSSAQGRFTSPDAPFADQNVGDPQSWNLYGYVRNNPLRHVDDNGAGAREVAQGVWQGAKSFASNTVTGLVNLASGLVTDPVGTVGLVASDIGDTLSLAGRTYFTSEGRSGLAASFRSMSDEERGAIITESLLVGAAAVLGPKVFKGGGAAAIETGTAESAVKAGSFSISNWTGYPAGVPKPPAGTTFRLLEGAEYQTARSAANQANQAIRKADPAAHAGKEIHEINPVKFGGSPTNPANKVALPTNVHRQQVTPWWNRLKKDLEGGASQ